MLKVAIARFDLHNLSLHIMYLYLVSSIVWISGDTMGLEGINITLKCDFNNSIPSVNNVIFSENGQSKSATLVSYSVTNHLKILLQFLKSLWVYRL